MESVNADLASDSLNCDSVVEWYVLCMGRPNRIEDMGIIVVGGRRREDEEEGVNGEEDLAEHVETSMWSSKVSCSREDEAISGTVMSRTMMVNESLGPYGENVNMEMLLPFGTKKDIDDAVMSSCVTSQCKV